jgi:hypothetical protein
MRMMIEDCHEMVDPEMMGRTLAWNGLSTLFCHNIYLQANVHAGNDDVEIRSPIRLCFYESQDQLPRSAFHFTATPRVRSAMSRMKPRHTMTQGR